MLGDRLREERARLRLNQAQMGAIAGAAKRTVIDWEKGATSPGAAQLSALSDAGFDVLYVLTGARSLPGSAKDDAYMLRDVHLREPEGDGPYHQLVRETMKRKAEHTVRREQRLAPIVERLAMCSDEDFSLIEAIARRIFDGAQGGKS